MGSARRVARISVKTLVYFYVVSTVALLLGLLVANLVPTGTGLNIDPRSIDTSSIAGYVSAAKEQGVVSFILNIIPVTLFDAFAKGAILQVVLIGAGRPGAHLPGRARECRNDLGRATDPGGLLNCRDDHRPVCDRGLRRHGLHRRPLRVAFPAAPAETRSRLLRRLPGLRAHRVGPHRPPRRVQPAQILPLYSRRNPALPQHRQLGGAAAAPDGEARAPGGPKSVVGLVVPTGYSFNLAGSSIYFTLCVIFIAQATNTALTLDRQLAILLVAMLMSKGATGFTGAGFVVLAGTLSALPDIPMAGLALLLGIDPFMQRGRGLTNYLGNGIAAIAIAAWEKDLDVALLKRRLDAGPDDPDSIASDSTTARPDEVAPVLTRGRSRWPLRRLPPDPSL